jgi:hypothetical protein
MEIFLSDTALAQLKERTIANGAGVYAMPRQTQAEAMFLDAEAPMRRL